MRAVVLGVGAVGLRAARQLVSSEAVEHVVVVDRDRARATAAAEALGAATAEWDLSLAGEADVVVLAHPGSQRAAAETALEAGTPVVSLADAVAEVRSLLDLDAEARERRLGVVVGAGFSPGLTCLLAKHAANEFDEVHEIEVDKVGTAGPACARQHHRALRGTSLQWRDGAWVEGRRSGRSLAWFPEPIGGRDCYFGALPDPLLLVPAFPGVERVRARVGASRRDRLTARLPMLRPPHAESGAGAVRVEVRGRRGGATDSRVLGVVDRPSVAAGATAAVAAVLAGTGRVARHGAGGLAEMVSDPLPVLHDLAHRGVRAAVFEGTGV